VDGAVHFEHGAPLGKASALRIVPVRKGVFRTVDTRKAGGNVAGLVYLGL
jgi:hypothetical protein